MLVSHRFPKWHQQEKMLREILMFHVEWCSIIYAFAFSTANGTCRVAFAPVKKKEKNYNETLMDSRLIFFCCCCRCSSSYDSSWLYIILFVHSVRAYTHSFFLEVVLLSCFLSPNGNASQHNYFVKSICIYFRMILFIKAQFRPRASMTFNLHWIPVHAFSLLARCVIATLLVNDVNDKWTYSMPPEKLRVVSFFCRFHSLDADMLRISRRYRP